MTAPPLPPDPNSIAYIVELGKKDLARAELVLSRLHLRYLLGILGAFVLICYGATKMYGWYEGRVARLEAAAGVLYQKLDAATAAGDVWRTQALALARQRHVDTVHTDSIITNTRLRAITVPFPVAQPDGSMQAVPMPVVQLSDFNALGGACTRERHDCSEQLAALSNVVVADSNRINALSDLYSNSEDQNRAQKRATFWTKISWGSGGAAAGFAAGFAAGSLACHR